MGKASKRLLGTVFGLLLGCSLNLLAADQPMREERIYAPPTVTLPEISLIDAVRIALDHDPNIMLREEQTEFQRGISQEATGQFDTSFLGNITLQYTQTELTDGAKKAERDKRKTQRDAADELASQVQLTEEQLAELIRLQNDPENYRLADPRLLDVQNQLDLVNALIRNADDPLVEAELTRLRDQVIQQQRENLERRISELKTEEVNALERLRKLGTIPEIDQSFVGSMSFRLIKPFRSGISISPSLEISGDAADFLGKDRDTNFGGKGGKDLYRADLGVSFDIPLGKGAGIESAASRETSSLIDYEASKYSLEHSSSSTVFFTALAYWDLVAAQQSVGIFEESRGLQGRLVGITRAMIQGDELPGVELPRVQASEAGILVTLGSAQRRLYDARVNLARSIGLNVEDIVNAPLASEDFPLPPAEAFMDQVSTALLIREAVARRYDYKSALQLQESGKILMRAARLDLRPLVNLRGDLKYTGLGEDSSIGGGVSRALFHNWTGPSTKLALSVDKPIENNVWEGRLLQREADYRQRAISSGDLERTIKAGVVQTYAALQEAARQVRESNNAVRYYREITGAEVERLRLGGSTLIDTITTEQRLVESQLGLISARQQYANLLAQLRFETGTLVTHTPEGSRVTEENLKRMPFVPNAP